MSDSAAETGAGATPATGAAGAAPATGAVTGAEGADAAGLLSGMLKEDGGGDGDLAEQLAHWKELARKHEKRAKENASAASRLQQIEDSNKTELQRAQDALAAAERDRDEAKFMHARVMAAAANNLPVELIEHLGSGTDDEINERAELFAKVIEETATAIAEQMVADQQGNRNGFQQPQPPGARPVESLRPGGAPAGGTPTTNEQWFRALLGQ